MKTIVIKTSLHLILPLISHLVLAHPRVDDWLVLARRVLGAQAQAAWLMDWQADEAEVYCSPLNALVIVHRDAGSIDDIEVLFHDHIRGIGGTRLQLIAPPDTSQGWVHSTHTGLLQGTPMVVDHFMILEDDMPQMLIRVVRPMQGSAPMLPFAESAFLRSLLHQDRSLPAPEPMVPHGTETKVDGIQPEQL